MNIEDRLIELVNKCADGLIDVDITESTNLLSDLGYTSLNLIELIVEIETEFDIEIKNNFLNLDLLSNFKSLLWIIKDSIEKNL